MSQHFTIRQLLGFTLPTVGMMVFMSAYSIADGFFVSNFCGALSLAAVNFTCPVPLVLGTVGFMLGTGGSAVVARTRGAGDDSLANRQFSFLVYAAMAAGSAFAAAGLLLLEPILTLLGAHGGLLSECLAYGTVLMAGIPFTVMQYLFQEFLVAAGKPKLGFGITLAAGIVNIALDALLIIVCGTGVRGAAVGTLAGEAVGGVVPIVYFARQNTSFLRLGKASLDWRTLGRACANGSSEMVSNIAVSVVSIAYNVQLLALIGEPGVAAYGVISYVGFAFAAVFMGYSAGVSPLMSYQYGAMNAPEMQSLFKKSLGVIAVFGFAMFAVSRFVAEPLAGLFVGYDPQLMRLAMHAFGLYSLSFLLIGFNVYGSALFTSLGNGLVSALISFARTLVCELGSVVLLPLALGPDGIWLSVVVAETVALALTAALVIWLGPHYRYLPPR